MFNASFLNIRYARVPAAAAAIWLAATMVIWGCGQKGPPEPPTGDRPPQVLDLSYGLTGNQLKLSWSIPETTARAKNPVIGFLIYMYQQPANERECPNCPVIFKQVGDVPVRSGGGARLKPVVFTRTIEPGYRYIFKVIGFDDGGIGSRDSNYVEFIY